MNSINSQRATILLESLLSHEFPGVIPHVRPLLLTSFGSFTRMDYGTGHETSFALFLLTLTLVRFFRPTEEEERHLVLRIFVRYLELCWKLQDTYRLEPAGSHGVWGLDDSSFLGYIFGSGQLRGSPPSISLGLLADNFNLFRQQTRPRSPSPQPSNLHCLQQIYISYRLQEFAR